MHCLLNASWVVGMELGSSGDYYGDISGQGGAGQGRLCLLGTVTDSYLLRAVAILGGSQSFFHEIGTAHRGRSPSPPGTGEAQAKHPAQAPEAGPGLSDTSDGALSSSAVLSQTMGAGREKGWGLGGSGAGSRKASGWQEAPGSPAAGPQARPAAPLACEAI